MVAFTTFILLSQDAVFSAQVAFVSLTLVNSLTKSLTFLPNGIAKVFQVCYFQIQKFIIKSHYTLSEIAFHVGWFPI